MDLQRNDCCWTDDDKVLHDANTPSTVKDEINKTNYQNYCPKLKRKLKVGVLFDHILTKNMNMHGM
jgi:hypothetical protein